MSGFAESAVVIGDFGEVIHWHAPAGRTAVHIPDSKELWDVLWGNRKGVLGVAHTHPGSGEPTPSNEDLTTFAATEAALGKRLKWWILTADCILEWTWEGPGRYQYSVDETRHSTYDRIWHPTSFMEIYLDGDEDLYPRWVDELRERSTLIRQTPLSDQSQPNIGGA